MENIKSPLNYTGNKFRILEQIKKHFPKKANCMIDLFCGGATVGINVECDKVIFVDNNERVLNSNTIKKSNRHIVLIQLSFLLFFISFHFCYYLLRKIIHVDSKKKADFFQRIYIGFIDIPFPIR